MHLECNQIQLIKIESSFFFHHDKKSKIFCLDGNLWKRMNPWLVYVRGFSIETSPTVHLDSSSYMFSTSSYRIWFRFCILTLIQSTLFHNDLTVSSKFHVKNSPYFASKTVRMRPILAKLKNISHGMCLNIYEIMHCVEHQ